MSSGVVGDLLSGFYQIVIQTFVKTMKYLQGTTHTQSVIIGVHLRFDARYLGN